MRRGQIVETGHVCGVLDPPTRPYKQALLDALLSQPGELLASDATEAAGRRDPSKLSGSAVGASANPQFIRMEGIDKLFQPPTECCSGCGSSWGLASGPARGHAVKSASSSIVRGEILGLAGESGSGKPALGRILCGIIAPNAGTVWRPSADASKMAR